MAILPAKPFYLMRHGETEANARGVVAGSLDTPLTEKGRQQAQASKPILKALPRMPELIVHSPLSRAKETAEILNQNYGLPMQSRASIAEQNIGGWAGISLKEWIMRRDAGLSPPEGETSEEFMGRVMAGFEEILSLPANAIFIVTHAGVIRAFMMHYGHSFEFAGNAQVYAFIPGAKNASFPWKICRYGMSPEGQVLSSSD